MHYFMYYPPKQAMRLIDVNENVLIEDILTLAKREFHFNIQNSGPVETSVVLSYNGSDLKPKWSLLDLGIPAGSIIRCIYREQKAADLYVYCSFNKQVFKLFDSSITIETTLATIRKKISDKLGLPLSVFCLETYHDRQRLYDQMKLINTNVKLHDHIYLKVWQGYENFINACIKGFIEQYVHDDLTRHYQAQVALHIAAFYGHMDLARWAMQQGARSDHPVGDHPSCQWSSELRSKSLLEMLKCPIHIAVERGHIKMVDLFVKQSILCTQTHDPISGHLPYKLALFRSLLSESKEDKERYHIIYFYLQDKQFNLRIPLNSTGEHVSSLLSSTSSAHVLYHSPSKLVCISLPIYCKIIRWYERACEKAWKKYGRQLYNIPQSKHIYPKHGLLGYKVLIDGFNNTFDVPSEQLRQISSSNMSKSNHDIDHTYLNEEEQEKIQKMKSFVKERAVDERTRTKQIVSERLQRSCRPPLLIPQTTSNQTKKSKINLETISSSFEYSNIQKRLNTSISHLKTSKTKSDNEKLLNANLTTSAFSKRNENLKVNETFKKPLKSTQRPSFSVQSPYSDETHTLSIVTSPTSNEPTTYSSLTNKIETMIDTHTKPFHTMMSSADAYTLSSTHIAVETEERNTIKRQKLWKDIKQSIDKQLQHQTEKSTNPLPTSFSTRRKTIDVDAYLPLPERPKIRRSSPIKCRHDIEIRRAAVESYERHASATTRSTAIHCLQEASYFKGKSWLKQVEVSKEMVKHRVKRNMHHLDDEKNNKLVLLPLFTKTPNVSSITRRPNTVKIH